ncbi:hypothetical protein [Burkholderia vietnamiensis]|uniref:hypothetical protein n=1 Tax=Burkholderia vietnamiensis TaxID=60552 RepID=UPI002651170F|nr:hypothetical protein [Burkholderia vietnamiensis]MDN7820475.1 hypothetical protein [Burkholderia vietnamiensis]
MKITDDMIFEWLSEIADEEIIARNRASIIEVGRRIEQAARRTTPDREAVIDKSMVKRLMVQHGLTHDRDTLIEEIAEMVDHMGEGRRLEEYVGAIREMKSGDKGGA